MLVGFTMLKFGVLGDVVTEFIKMSFYAWDRLSVFHLVIEDREQWMGYAGRKM